MTLTQTQPVHLDSPQRYYAQHSPLTNPGEYAPLLVGLPSDVRALCDIVQGLHMHYMEGTMYGIEVPKERVVSDEARDVAVMLRQIQALDARPLSEARPPERRLVGCCRDFALMLCAMLRQQGVPARVRYGFSLYFTPRLGCDHVVCEYWKSEEQRWVLVDPQQDELHRQMNKLAFDPYDIPRDRFPVGGEVWQACRNGTADPEFFGYSHEARGYWVIQHYLVHDFAALNGREMLIGDCWGAGNVGPGHMAVGEEAALLDQAATLATGGDGAFRAMRAFYEATPSLRVPEVVSSYSLTDEFTEQVRLAF